MSITEGTQPAAITWTGAWTTAQTTASFTPESGALLVALLAGDGDGVANTTATISDSLTGTWTQLALENTAATGLGGIAAVWCRDSPNASMTVSVTGGVHTANGGQLVVRTLIGALAAASQPGATGVAGPAPGTIQVSVAAGTGNKVYGAAFNFDNSAAMTALANTTVISQFSDTTNGDDWEAFKSSGDTAGTATYGYSTSVHGMIAAAEIIAAPSTAAAGVSQARPGRTWLRRFHHRQSPPVAPLVTAAAAPFAAELLQPPFPQRPAPHRARMGALGACAAGILAVTTLSPQPSQVPPSRPAPVVNRHLPPHRAVWDTLAGPAPPAVQAAPAAPARPQPPTSRPTPPHRAVTRWVLAKTTLSPQPTAVPPARPRPPAYRPPGAHRGVWDTVAGAPPAAQAAEQVVTLLPVTAVSPRPPHRATGKGILAKTTLSPQPSRVPPPQWRQPNAPRPAHRAIWRALAGPAPPVVVVTAVPPSRPQPPAYRPPGPHRATGRGILAKTTLSPQPASVPAPHWVPQPRYRPPHRAVWDTIAGLPPVPGKSAPARPRPPAYRPPGPHRGTWRLQAGPQPPPPPPFQVARSTPTVADPRDGTATVTARATSTPAVTDPRDGTPGVT